jgi:acyl carrier protein
MDDSIEIRIKNVMSAVFEIPVDQIKDNSSADTIESWDSLKHMNLVIALEEEFQFQFNDEQTREMLNYSLIYTIIKEMLK